MYAAVIPAFVDSALRDKPLTVHGDGTQSRDFTHVSTVCATIIDALERKVTSSEPVNLAFGSRISLREVLSLLGEHLDRPLVVDHTESRVGDVPHSQADSTLLRTLFPDISPIAFDQGLIETIEWMRSEIVAESTENLRASS